MSYFPYDPCDNCPQKGKLCHQCALTNLNINYQRALDKVRELSAKLGIKITILV